MVKIYIYIYMQVIQQCGIPQLLKTLAEVVIHDHEREGGWLVGCTMV